MDLWKFTPLHEAAAKGKYEICKLLLKVISIFSNKNYVIIYKQYGADVHRKNRDNLTPLDLVKDPESDLADLLRGDTALLDAAKKGDIDRVSQEKAKSLFLCYIIFQVKKLVTEENVNCRDEYGRNSTPLHLAGLIDPCVLYCYV